MEDLKLGKQKAEIGQSGPLMGLQLFGGRVRELAAVVPGAGAGGLSVSMTGQGERNKKPRRSGAFPREFEEVLSPPLEAE
jgi:hypothetical protein